MKTPKDIRHLLPVDPLISADEWRRRYLKAVNWAVAGWVAALALLGQIFIAVWLLAR